MSSKSEKERQKQIQDKCLAILAQLLRDEDNKYCVDCDAKGPRWASWNLGIFLCIRCAGIHRNLGVHISKVKSVNLDSWTPEQVAYLQEMGNSRARAVYEANLPDNFRRPQTDSSLEAFIRSKYETKKYIAKEWVPPQISKIVFEFDDEKKRPKEKKTQKSSALEVRPPVSAKKSEPDVDLNKSTARPKSSGTADLLELSEVSAVKPQVDDFFGGFISAETSQVPTTTNSASTAGAELTEFANEIDQGNLFAQSSDSLSSLKKQPLSNESILSLYNQGGSGQQPQMMGMPLGSGNMYMGQPQGAFGQPQGISIPAFGQNGVPPVGGNAMGGALPNVPLNSGNLGTNPFLGPGLNSSLGSWYPPTNYSPQQLQMQMASLNLGQPQYPGMVSHQALPNPNNVSWTGQQPGHTLSVNLWK